MVNLLCLFMRMVTTRLAEEDKANSGAHKICPVIYANGDQKLAAESKENPGSDYI
jgi:hypothetical protein